MFCDVAEGVAGGAHSLSLPPLRCHYRSTTPPAHSAAAEAASADAQALAAQALCAGRYASYSSKPKVFMRECFRSSLHQRRPLRTCKYASAAAPTDTA